MPKQLSEEWKALDFQNEVRPIQLDKLKVQLNQIAKIGQELQANNKNSLGQIDASYK